MPKQKTITTGNRGGGRHNRSRNTTPLGRTDSSVTPSAEPTGPAVKLKLNIGGRSGNRNMLTAPVGVPLPDIHSKGELPIAESSGRTTRAGRVTKKPKYDDYVLGSELDQQVDASSVQKADDEESEEYRGMKSSPPGILTLQQQRRKPGRPHKNALFQPSLAKVDEEDGSSSETFAAASPRFAPQFCEAFTFVADKHVYDILDSLQGSAKIHIDLPSLENAANLHAEQPYSATFLTHLYIVCYNAKQWNLCDLVADTWIRAFHALRKKAEKNGNEKNELWRPNEALRKRRRQGQPGFDESAPHYKLQVLDPALEPDVTTFRSDLLSELYNNTSTNCGARLLWADAMALCGSKLEANMVAMKKSGDSWHPDLMHDLLCTTLRMVRRKLTLKIEEGTEGAWCKRYHEHSKHGLPCYREEAWRRKNRGEDSDEYEEDDGDSLAAAMVAELSRPEKRGCGEVDGGIEMGEAKRVRFGDGEREVVDVDAEGESEDE